jgi:ABC-2 type transport system ATP-binding protein
MRDVIKKLGRKHTVILSSHILQEVSAVCDRIMIINRGVLVASDTPERLSSNLTHGHQMTARVKGEQGKILSALEAFPVIKSVKVDGSVEPGTYDLIMSGDDNVDIREAIFNCMAKNNLPILQLKSMDLTLEEIFLQVTTGSSTDAEPDRPVKKRVKGGAE